MSQTPSLPPRNEEASKKEGYLQKEVSQSKSVQVSMGFKAALIRVLPRDHVSFMESIARVAAIAIACIDYAHTRNIDNFLLLSGLGGTASFAVRKVANQRRPKGSND